MKPKTILVLMALMICVVAIVTSRVKVSNVTEPLMALSATRGTDDWHTQSIAQRPWPAFSRITVDESVRQLSDEIERAFASSDLAVREFALTNLFPALISQDTAAAARIAEKITGDDLREEALHRVAEMWAAQDPVAALKWAGGLALDFERDAALTDICLRVAETDPAEATRTRAASLADSNPNSGLENLTQQWAEKDFASALDWTLSRTEGDQRDGLVARLAFLQSQTDPIEAANLVVERMDAGAAQDDAILSVLHRWALRDLAAAVSWVEKFPEMTLRGRAKSELEAIAAVQQLATNH